MQLRPLDVSIVSNGASGLSVPSEVMYLPEIDSTNRFLADLASSELRHGLAVLADFQSDGKGRLGRRWIAPARSSILLSIAVRPPRQTPAHDVVMMGALAVRDAVRASTSLVAAIKWPNDVVILGHKVCGILAESIRHHRDSYTILGIGLNVNIDAATMRLLSPDSTSLFVELGAEVNRETLAVNMFKSLDMWYRCLQRDPDVIFETWSKGLDTLGKAVQVRDAVGLWQGIATEVQRDGGLAVRKDNGEVRVVFAADVSVRPFQGFTSAE